MNFEIFLDVALMVVRCLLACLLALIVYALHKVLFCG